MNISSQDFRNAYEKFYARMRNYLWPYSTLQYLADIEVNIYSSFVDIEKFKNDLNKLYSAIREVCVDDEKLSKAYKDLEKLTLVDDPSYYYSLYKVEEVNPENEKQIRTIPEEEEEEDE